MKVYQIMGMLGKVWLSRRLMLHIKMTLYKTLVRFVCTCWYGCKSWYDNETIHRLFILFENKVLGKILEVKWQDRMINSLYNCLRNNHSFNDRRLDEVLMSNGGGSDMPWDGNQAVSYREHTRGKWTRPGEEGSQNLLGFGLTRMKKEAADPLENIEGHVQGRSTWKDFTSDGVGGGNRYNTYMYIIFTFYNINYIFTMRLYVVIGTKWTIYISL